LLSLTDLGVVLAIVALCLVVPILPERGAFKRGYAPAPTGKSCSAVATGCPASTPRL